MKKKSLQFLIMLTKYSAYGFLLHLLLMTSLSAREGNAQNRSIKEVNIDIHLKNVRVEKALQSIEGQTEFVFVFTPEDLKEIGRVTLDMDDRSVSDILTEISRQSKLQFKQVNDNISVKRLDMPHRQSKMKIFENVLQAQTITGKVISAENDEELPGVNVIIKGTSQGTVTDISGNYSIDVPSVETVLVFSSVGFEPEEVQVGQQSVINVNMMPDIKALEEIVVVGYGTMERSNVTGSIVTVDVDEIQKTPIPNAVEALRGRVAGLQVTRGSGQPGAGVSFRIRGTNSLGGARGNNVGQAISDANQPIIVIDGVPVPGGNLAEINPDDIESMNILKDAAASAIYGSSGANGAILITTKSGKKGATKFSVDTYTGYVELANRLDMMNGDEYVKYLLDSRRAVGETSPTVSSVLDPTELRNYVDGNESDWQDLMIRTGRQHNVSVGASGGGDNYSFYINGDAYLEDGIIKASDYERYSFRLNSDFRPTNWLQVGARIQLVRSVSDETSNVISDFNVNNAFAPYIPISTNSPLGDVYDSEGNFAKFINTDRFQINPLHRYNESIVDRIVNRSFVNPYVNIELGGGFTYTLNTFAENRNEFYGRFQSSNYGDDDPSEAQVQQTTTKNYLIDNILTYSKTFAGKHSVNATLVYGMQKFEYERSDIIARNIPTDLLGYNAIGDALDNMSRVNWDTDENGRVYAVGRVGYAYDHRYNLTVSLRRDGSSKFGPNYRFGYFPSASFAWNASNEAFLKNSDIVSLLKVRASYGVLGNDNIGTYLYRAGASNIQILVGVDEDGNEVTFNGYGVGADASNPNLRWEESRQINLGLDFGFLSNRLSGNFDIWKTNTTDLLLYETIIPVNGGFSQYPSNVGETENWGIDVGLNGEVMNRNDFTWRISANWSMDRNKIVRLSRANEDEEGNPVDNPANGWFIGQNIAEIYDYKYVGVWQIGEESEAAEFGAVPGDPKIADIDGNGVINDQDRTFLGNPTPSWYGGITNIFTYKGFELSVLIEAVQGVARVNSYIGGYTGRGNQVNINYWTPENPSNEFPRVGNGNAMAGGLFANSIKIQDASFVALRNVSLSYNLPQQLLQNLPLSGVNIYARGNNLKYWTDYTLAFSPESGPGSYPITRTWVFGARLTF